MTGCTLYRLVNNEQLQTAQESQLVVDLGLAVNSTGDLVRQVLSDVGQADYVALLATFLNKLKVLLHLTKIYCDRYHISGQCHA